jgi:hypothetical protein
MSSTEPRLTTHTPHHGARSERAIVDAIDNAFSSANIADSLPSFVHDTAESGFIDSQAERKFLVDGWTRALNRFLEPGLFDASQEALLVRFKELFHLSNEELGAANAYPLMVKAEALRDLTSGKLPDRCHIVGTLPINLHKDERLVWAFPDTNYYTHKTQRKYVGASAGVSVRVAKGLYFHTSSFRGNPIDVSTTQKVDTGIFAVTNKNLYFAGPIKAIRVPFAKVISFQKFSDGIGFFRDGANAKQEAFATGDGWFTYNLIVHVAKL